ncbi:hypothetical protein WS62_29165 [Burkholderia sp. ABCPW 14]|nr:hypothetical protein WS62_29165 [Burkholderia sp. ABCPW 14]
MLHDAAAGNAAEQAINQKILSLLPQGAAQRPMVAPDLEGFLGYWVPRMNKAYVPVYTMEIVHFQGQLPTAFQQAVCMAYFDFGQLAEP